MRRILIGLSLGMTVMIGGSCLDDLPGGGTGGGGGGGAGTVTQPAGTSAKDTIPFLLTIHMESSTSRVCDGTNARCVTDDEWNELMGVTERLIEDLDMAGLKGTFQFQIHWMTRLQDSARGLAIIQAMIAGGHEIGMHHHGFTHNDWNGYSDDPAAANGHDIYTDLVARPMSEYMDIVHAFEQRFGVDVTTVEGTDLAVDGQDEWIYRTGDDMNNPEAEVLYDVQGVCPVGRPTWSAVTLPNAPRAVQGTGVTSIGHTHFGTKTPACTEVVSAHVLERIDEIIAAGTDSTQVVNFVLHPSDYGTNVENEVAFSSFFATVGAMDELEGMTVQEYMCQRVSHCIR